MVSASIYFSFSATILTAPHGLFPSSSVTRDNNQCSSAHISHLSKGMVMNFSATRHLVASTLLAVLVGGSTLCFAQSSQPDSDDKPADTTEEKKPASSGPLIVPNNVGDCNSQRIAYQREMRDFRNRARNNQVNDSEARSMDKYAAQKEAWFEKNCPLPPNS